MNARRVITSTILAGLLALWAPGCLEHTVKTTVNADGTCERVITIKTDGRAKEIPKTPFPLLTDASWDTSWSREGWLDESDYLTLRKRFRDFDEISQAYNRPPDTGNIHLELRVWKEFRWFYTYYHYRESYGRFTAYTLVPPEAVLSEDEIQRYTYGSESDTLKNKVQEWIARNLYEELFTHLTKGAESLRDSLLSPSMLQAHKEDFFRLMVGYTGPGKELQDPDSILMALSSYRGKKAKFLEGTTITEDGLRAFMEIAARTFGSKAIWNLKDSLQAGWQAMEEMIERDANHGESFKSSVVLPGILLETNAPEVKGSEASWKFSIDRLSLRSYEMRAGSRVVNAWVIALTGVVALGLLALLIISIIRRSSQARGVLPMKNI